VQKIGYQDFQGLQIPKIQCLQHPEYKNLKLLLFRKEEKQYKLKLIHCVIHNFQNKNKKKENEA